MPVSELGRCSRCIAASSYPTPSRDQGTSRLLELSRRWGRGARRARDRQPPLRPSQGRSSGAGTKFERERFGPRRSPTQPPALLTGLVTASVVSEGLAKFLNAVGGGGGIRTPGELPHGGFQNRCLRPLGHSSRRTRRCVVPLVPEKAPLEQPSSRTLRAGRRRDAYLARLGPPLRCLADFETLFVRPAGRAALAVGGQQSLGGAHMSGRSIGGAWRSSEPSCSGGC